MRILRITPHYYFAAKEWPPLLDPIGGMHVQTTGFTEWLRDRHGDEHTVLAMGLPSLPTTVSQPNIEIISTKLFGRPKKKGVLLNQSWMAGTLLWLARNSHKVRHQYDVIHVHSAGVASSLTVSIFCKLLFRIPLVLTVHRGRISTFTSESRVDALAGAVVRPLEKLALRLCDQAIFLTKKACDIYTSLLPLGEKANVIGDAVFNQPCGDGMTLPDTLRSFLELDGPTILYVGRVSWEKGWDDFLRFAAALSRTTKAKFLMCGDGPEGKNVQELARSLGIEDRFLFTGFVPKEVVAAVMARADLLVVPSRHEEFGGVIIEAGINKLPVLASRTNGPSKLLRHEETGYLVDIGDVEGFATVAGQILGNRARAHECARRFYAQVLERFSPDSVGSRIRELYERSRVRQSAAERPGAELLINSVKSEEQ